MSVSARHARVDEIAALKPGWLDGEGEAPSAAAVNAAHALINSMLREPHIYPTPEGGIQFEASTLDRRWAWEITIDSDGAVEAYAHDLELRS